MPVDITDVDAFTDPDKAPANGDAVDATTMLDYLQRLSNRTRFLKNILQSTGVAKVRTFANAAALKAVTGQVDGDIAVVLAGPTSPKIFVYSSSTTTLQDDEYCIRPNSIGSDASPGRWTDPLAPAVGLGGTPGFSRVLDAAKVRVPNQLLQVSFVDGPPSGFVTNSTTYTDITGLQWGPIALEAGDYVELTGAFKMDYESGSPTVDAAVTVYLENQSGFAQYTTGASEGFMAPVVNTPRLVPIVQGITVPVSGNYKVRNQVKSGHGTINVRVWADSGLQIRVIRP